MSLEDYIRRRVDADPITLRDQELLRKKGWNRGVRRKGGRHRRNDAKREQRWIESHHFPVTPGTPTREATLTRTLQVSTEYFTAGAVFRRVHGVWGCEEAAPVIRWMVGKGMGEIKVALLKMGAKWEWLERKVSP